MLLICHNHICIDWEYFSNLSSRIMRLMQSCLGSIELRTHWGGKHFTRRNSPGESKVKDEMFYWGNVRLLEYDCDHGPESKYSCFWIAYSTVMLPLTKYSNKNHHLCYQTTYGINTKILNLRHWDTSGTIFAFFILTNQIICMQLFWMNSD